MPVFGPETLGWAIEGKGSHWWAAGWWSPNYNDAILFAREADATRVINEVLGEGDFVVGPKRIVR